MAPSLGKLRRQGCLRDFLLFLKHISIVHGSVKDAFIDADGVIIIKFIIAKDILAIFWHCFIVAGTGENVAIWEPTRIPFRGTSRNSSVDFIEVSSAFLKHIFHILVYDAFDGSVINLTVVIISFCL